MSILTRIASLLGISAYTQPKSDLPSLGSGSVERGLKQYGGQLSPLPQSQTRWYMSDLETAEHAADQGYLAQAARLMRASRKDGVRHGVMTTRTSGLVRLPKRFRGDADIVHELEMGHEYARSVFEEMCPASELSAMVEDGVDLGVAVGQLVPVIGRDYPVLVRLDPEFLRYRWNENRWYFGSLQGELPITPGDGHWVLHTPGGRMAPWQRGLWRAIGKAYIRKEHAQSYKDNWESKLAHSARVAIAPSGATEEESQKWFRRVMAWGVNTVFGMRPGYDVKLLESNGRGHESFDRTIAQADMEIIVAIAGQTVTTDGGTGFANADIHKSIRSDIIKDTADALAYTLNTQVLPQWISARYGEDALHTRTAIVEWDVSPPKDRNSEATAMVTVGSAIQILTQALAPHGIIPDVQSICERAGVPVLQLQREPIPSDTDVPGA